MKDLIYSKYAPNPIGPYSQAIKYGSLIFLSGQIPVNPESGKIESNDIESQTYQVFKNISSVLGASNTTFNDVIKTTIFLTDINNFKIINKIYSSYFNSNTPPARSTVEVSALPLNALIEIELITAVNE